jgi:hypothetical protein
MPEPIPTAAPQSEAIPTMADGGALREHAKRLESLPRDATDPATLEYFSAVRAYSGKQPSDPPPPNAARTFASNEVSTPQQADNRGPDKSPKGFENPPRQPPLQPQSPPEPQPPVFRTAEMAPPVVETPTPAQKPKGALRQAWQETSRVKKAIVFLMPLAAVVTIYQFEPQAEPESPPAPAVNDEKVGAATASVTKEVSPPPSAGALGSAQATEEASAAASAAAAGLKTAVEAPSSSATAGSVNSIQVQPVASGAKPAPVGIASATASATNAAATSSAPPPQPPGSAVPTGVASGAVATAAPGSTEMVQPEAALMAHDALTAAFDGNLARSASLYQQLSSAHPTSQLYSLAARFTKEGAVRTP